MDYRKIKRAERKLGISCLVQQAFYEGQCVAEHGRDRMPPRYRTNPYPPGRRHDAFEHGQEGFREDQANRH